MAYRSRGTRRSSRTVARRRVGARSGYRASRVTRRAPARGRRRTASAGGRTVRIVIEQVAANTVQRPDLGLMASPKPRQPKFA